MSHLMTTGLPDPDTQAAFYRSIPAKRLFAWVIDVALIAIISVVAVLMSFGILGFFFPLLFIVLSFFYRWITLAGGSATLGMRVMAIEIRNGNGHRLDSGEAMLHTLTYMVATAFFLPQLLSMGLMVFGPRRQGLHDLVLGTAAINRPG